jgi:hypothetical protein
VTLLREPTPEEACHLELVVDDQDAHRVLIVTTKMRVR